VSDQQTHQPSYFGRGAAEAPAEIAPDPDPTGLETALERVKALLVEEPEFVFWKDRRSVYRGCNLRFAQAAGLESPDEIVGKTDHELAWTETEADFYVEVDNRVMATGIPEYHIVESQLQADGRRVWIDTSKVPIFDASGAVTGLLGVFSDITDRVESEKVVTHGTQIFRAMSFTARTLNSTVDWTTVIIPVLEQLGLATEVSRATLFSMTEQDDDVILSHRFEWVAAGVEPRADNHLIRAVPMRKVGLGRFLYELEAGRCVHARVSSLSSQERRILEDQGVLSVATVPIMAGSQLWGFIEFDDCATERRWLISEIEALRSAAIIIGAAIQRQRDARALRLETRRFEQLYENMPLAVLVADPEETIVAVNPAFEALFGFTGAEIVGRKVNELITPPERIEEASRLSRRTFDGESVALHSVRRRKDGTPVPVQIFGVPVTQDGEVELIYGIYVDQTEQLRAEAALRESEEKFRSLAEQSLQGIFVIRNRMVAYANRMMADITGFDLEEVLAFDQVQFERLIHPADRALVMASANGFKIGSGRSGVPSEYRLITKSGEIKWVLQQTRTVQFDGEPSIEGVLVDITQRKHAEEQLLYSALHDQLTGLPNRASFHDRVELALERARGRVDSPFAVLFLDVDRFKLVNDGYGHQVGDRLLVEIAQRLRRAVRPGDTVARIGGDEFTVLIPDIAGHDEVVSVAQRIHHALSLPFSIGGEEVFTTASTGIAISSSRYESPDEILRDADIAMYHAKAEGRARHHMYDEAMHPMVLSQLHLENDLRRALDRREFRLHYQPIIDTRSGSIVACEALLRWQHPERGLLPPSEFLRLAEETGLINPIGEWVLRSGCRRARDWMHRLNGHGSPAVSINLFSRQFSQPELVVYVKELLDEHQLPPDRLQLEITESAVIDVPELAIDVMRRLRDLGVKVHIDDFGTGYSSLAYLQRFAVDTLKIDRGFIKRLGINDEGSEIVRTIIALARNLGMEALAEGIEKPEQLHLAREMGCDFAQGFLISKPLPPEEIQDLLEQGPLQIPLIKG